MQVSLIMWVKSDSVSEWERMGVQFPCNHFVYNSTYTQLLNEKNAHVDEQENKEKEA